MYRGIRVAALGVAFSFGVSAAQAVTFTTGYSQNFDTLAASGTGTLASLPDGWTVTETGSSANATYSAGTGSNTIGDTYSFGSAAASDRALGTLRSGTLIPTINATFTNGNAATVTDLGIAYTGEQWRLGTVGRADRLDFSYSLDNVTFTAFSDLSFSSPITTGTAGALNGNLAANRTAIAGTLAGVNLASGASIYLRWTDIDATGADDGLAIDDFSLTSMLGISAVPETANWAMMVAGFGLIGAAARRRRTAIRFV